MLKNSAQDASVNASLPLHPTAQLHPTARLRRMRHPRFSHLCTTVRNALAGAVILTVLPQASFAQSTVLEPPVVVDSNRQPAVEERLAAKPVVPSASSSSQGATFVALEPGLASVFDGREPTTLAELRALEVQQQRVAEAIDRVTVNVQQGTAQGSGVIIREDGYVLTAAHVAGDANRDATVILSDGTRLRARTLGMNRDKDAGLIKIVEMRGDGKFPYATPGKSEDLKIGQWCIASGHPGGWRSDRGAAIRVGRVLSIKRDRQGEAHTLFTDCALIGGDSGGPLFTLEGKLVGIHSRIGTDVSDNMHVPIDVFSASWTRMVRKEVWGALPGFQPIIGVSGTKGDTRPLLSEVDPLGPAAHAGLQAGDLVMAVDGTKIRSFDELRMAVGARSPGDVMILKIQRGEEILKLPVIVGVDSGGPDGP